MGQENIQTKLFAFLNAEEMRMVETGGHYDADRRMWVGEYLSSASGDTCLCPTPTCGTYLEDPGICQQDYEPDVDDPCGV